LPSFFFLLEGLSGGFSSGFLLLWFVEVVRVQLLFISDVDICDRQELVESPWTIQSDNLFNVCAFAQTFGNEVLFHGIFSTSYLDNIFVEYFDVVSKRFALSLDDGLEGGHRFWLRARHSEVGCELVAEVAPRVYGVSP